MDSSLEKECSALGGLFQSIVGDLKGCHGIWEDLCVKSTKLHTQLRGTIVAVSGFLDALQRVADVATSAKGATRDIGTTLTRVCMRHRSIENRLKTLTSALIDCLVTPLQERIEDWRRCAVQMDREHGKEYKRCRSEIKKRRQDAGRLQKKVRKGQSTMRLMLDSAVQEINDRSNILLQVERQAVRQALVEQRSQFCLFVSWFKPILDGELSLIHEAAQLQELVDLLSKHSADPYTLPLASEAVITDVKGLENTWRFQTPPSSPGSSYGSRKSSFCSLSSAESSFHQSSVVSNRQVRPHDLKPAAMGIDGKYVGGSSVRSQDSGFLSRDSLYPSRPAVLIPAVKPVVSDCDGFPSANQEGSEVSTPSPSSSLATWPEGSRPYDQVIEQNNTSANIAMRPHTISAGFTNVQTIKRRPLNEELFLGSRASSQPPPAYKCPMNKPPLPPKIRQHPGGSDAVFKQSEAKDCQIYYNVPPSGATDKTHFMNSQDKPARPLSFAGVSEFSPPAYNAVTGSRWNRYQTSGKEDDQESVIANCMEEIEQLSFELDGYSKESRSVLPRVCDHVAALPAGDGRSSLSSFCTLPRSCGRLIGVQRVPLRSIDEVNECRTPTYCTSEESDLTPRANGCGLPPPPVFAACAKRRSIAGRLPPPPPARRNSSITSATPNAPAVNVIRSNSRCATPIEDTYSDVIYALNARLSSQQLNRSSETILETNDRNYESGSSAILSKSLQETFYSLPYGDCVPNVAQLKSDFRLHQAMD